MALLVEIRVGSAGNFIAGLVILGWTKKTGVAISEN
jgi:hypothetical protein